jgi:hypothetical protein
LEEQGVALGDRPDSLEDVGFELCSGDRLDQSDTLGRFERAYADHLCTEGQGLASLDRSRSGQDQEDHRLIALRAGAVVDQVEKPRLGPLQVIEQQEQRAWGRDRLEQPPNRQEQLLDRRLDLGQAERRADSLGDGGCVLGRDQVLDSLDGGFGGAPVRDHGRRSDHLVDRPERDPLAIREATALEHGRPVADRLDERRRKARLADSRLPHHRHAGATAALDRPLETPRQLQELPVSADQWRLQHPPDAGLTRLDVYQSKGGERFGLPLESQGLDLGDVDRVSHELVRVRPEQDLTGWRRLLEAGGDVDRIAGGEVVTAR